MNISLACIFSALLLLFITGCTESSNEVTDPKGSVVEFGDCKFQDVNSNEIQEVKDDCLKYSYDGKSRLAIDLNLFQIVIDEDGYEKDIYLDKTEDHERLGQWWEDNGGIWGGRFDDGNHYEWPLGRSSFIHNIGNDVQR